MGNASQVKSDIVWLLSQGLCLHCSSIYCRQNRLSVKDFVARLVSTFVFQYCKVPSRRRDQNRGVEGPSAQLLHELLQLNESCACSPWQWGPMSLCGEQPFHLVHCLGYLRISMGSCWSTTQLDIIQSYYQKSHHKRWPVETLYPLLLEVFIRVTFIDIPGNFHCTKFPYYHAKCPLSQLPLVALPFSALSHPNLTPSLLVHL